MGVNDAVPPVEAQGISGTAAGVNPTLPTVVTVQGDPAGVPIPVTATITPPALQDVNLTEIGGTPVTDPLSVDATIVGGIPNPLPIDGGNPTPVDVTGTVAITGVPDPIGADINSVPNTGSATVANVSDSASSVTLLAANSARLGASVYNDSTQNLYLKLGATASLTSFSVRLVPQAYYELPVGPLGCYTGIIDGIWEANASGAARVTEY